MASELAGLTGIELLLPANLAPHLTDDFREDPRIDFGRVVRRTPRAVLRPRDREQLRVAIRFLRDEGIPAAVRGSGHSSGGQALIEDGVVLDLRHLNRLVADDPAAETITVEGGARWLDVARHLRAQGRRPRSLLAHLRQSVAGTLAVGGFGCASHLSGLVIADVVRLTLLAPDGTLLSLGPDDELFRFSLAGRGQLGVIVDATLRTVRRPREVATRELRWTSLADFVEDAAAIAAAGEDDFLRARLSFGDAAEPGVVAAVGRSATTPWVADGAERRARRAMLGNAFFDLVDGLSAERPDPEPLACPALELVLPLPDGLAAWPELVERIIAADVPRLQPAGPSVMWVPADPRLPLAPTPTPTSLMVALRPMVDPSALEAPLAALRALGRRALELGARTYLMSIELDAPDFLARQFGDALPRLRALKAELDPDGLLNPGLLTP